MVDFGQTNCCGRLKSTLQTEEIQLREDYINNYKATDDANKKYRSFKNKYKKELYKAKLLRKTGDLDKPENAKYKELELKRVFLYNDYKKSSGERDARETAFSLLDKMGLKEQYEYERTNTNNALRMGIRTLSGSYRGWLHSGRSYEDARGISKYAQLPRISENSERNEKINLYFQPAYHGTPHRFNKFSTEYIGTGEKAQAHGWGLYFAGNKDISENYRESLLAKYYPEAINPTIPEKL